MSLGLGTSRELLLRVNDRARTISAKELAHVDTADFLIEVSQTDLACGACPLKALIDSPPDGQHILFLVVQWHRLVASV